MAHIILVGAGNMGSAMLLRWLTKADHVGSVVEPEVLHRCTVRSRHTFAVVEPAEALRERAERAGAHVYASVDDLPAEPSPDVVVIATKPQTVGEMAECYSPRLAPTGLIISVAAGVDIETIEKRARGSFAVIRCMPNMPASIGEGMTVCCPNTRVTAAHRAVAQDLLSSIGRVVFVEDEQLMDAVTAISGSGPAYLFLFIEALSQAARAAGLESGLAMLLVKQTIYGASKLALESDDAPATLRKQVTSPNGTTAAALDVLLRPGNGLTALVHQAVTAAKAKSIKLRKP